MTYNSKFIFHNKNNNNQNKTNHICLHEITPIPI